MKRIFAIILAIIMCISLLPGAALAEDETPDEEKTLEDVLPEDQETADYDEDEPEDGDEEKQVPGEPEAGDDDEDDLPDGPSDDSLVNNGPSDNDDDDDKDETDITSGNNGDPDNPDALEENELAKPVLENIEDIALKSLAANEEQLREGETNTCGEDVYWELSSDSTSLNIWGTGAMTEFSQISSVPWYNQRSTITQITVGEGVTSIGKYSFYNCQNLSSVSLPSTLTNIGASSFAACSSLASITLPQGITSIGGSAFSECTGMTGITFPGSLLTIGASAFSYCENLESITLPAGLTTIGAYAFQSCTKLTEVTIPGSVTALGTSVFKDCTALTTAVLSEGLTTTGTGTFSGCNVLCNISLPESLTELGEKAFSDCYRIVSIQLPQGLKSIGKQAFYMCNYLNGIDLPNGLTSIGYQAFYHCSALQAITIPASVTVCDSAFYETQLRTVVLSEGFTSIGPSMFYNCPKLSSITFPESLTTIGSSAFEKCSSLTSISFPENITSIGSGAFERCTSLTEFIIPSTITTLENNLFRGCKALRHIVIPANITTIRNNVFAGSGLQSIVIPNTVTSIGDNMFGKTTIEKVDYQCDWLESVVLPDNLTSIPNYTFRSCTNLSSVNIPSSVTSIGEAAFQYTRITEFTVPDGVAKIPNDAFNGCTLLKTVTIPVSVTQIGHFAFDTCRSLTDVYYKGTQTQWNSINIGYYTGTDYFGTATKHYMGSTTYKIAAFAMDMDNNVSVSNVVISPDRTRYSFDTEVSVTAQPAQGYTFCGWYPATVSGGQVINYDANTLLANTLSYTFKIRENTNIVAVYQAAATVSVTVHPLNGAAYSISNGGGIEEYDIDHTISGVPLSSNVTITALDADKVLQWENQNRKLLGRGPSLTLTVVGSAEVYLVYREEEAAGGSYVQFVSDYGHVISEGWYDVGATVSVPAGPTKLGYNFERWIFSDTSEDATAAAIQSRIGQESVIVVKPEYTKDSTTYTVTVSYKNANGNAIGVGSASYSDIEVGRSYTVTAPSIQGYLFSCWKKGDTVLSYKADYLLQVAGDVDLTACYDMVETEVLPVITLSEPSRVISGDVHRISVSATRSIPEGYTLVEHGMLYAKDLSGVDEETFVSGADGVKKYISNDTAINGVVKVNLKVASDDIVASFRGYMILRKNSTGNLETLYTDIVSTSFASINN